MTRQRAKKKNKENDVQIITAACMNINHIEYLCVVEHIRKELLSDLLKDDVF